VRRRVDPTLQPDTFVAFDTSLSDHPAVPCLLWRVPEDYLVEFTAACLQDMPHIQTGQLVVEVETFEDKPWYIQRWDNSPSEFLPFSVVYASLLDDNALQLQVFEYIMLRTAWLLSLPEGWASVSILTWGSISSLNILTLVLVVLTHEASAAPSESRSFCRSWIHNKHGRPPVALSSFCFGREFPYRKWRLHASSLHNSLNGCEQCFMSCTTLNRHGAPLLS
jgi:hypothetical protein